ncbi:MAG: hypothetical protein KC503_28340 [Myxococcales bacterium]|nr:hypothetical protein [Myxococcales bacterium]
MSHRDDLDAAMHRIASLERELDASERDSDEKAGELATLRAEVEKLRARVDEQSARERRAAKKQERQRRAESPAGRAADKRRRAIIGTSMTVVLVGAVILGGLFLPRYCARRNAHTKPGRLARVELVGGGSGGNSKTRPRLLVTSSVYSRSKHLSFTYWRVDIVDAHSGKRERRLVLEDAHHTLGQPTIADAGAGRLWFVYRRRNKSTIELRSASDLALLTSHQALLDKNPLLVRGLYGRPQLDAESHGLVLTTRSGDRLLLDAKSGRATSLDKVSVVRPGPLYRSRVYSTHRVRVDGAYMHFGRRDGGPKQVLQRSGSGAYPSGSDLLHPRFLCAGRSDRPLRLPAGAGLVITRVPVLGAYEKLIVSSIDLDGKLGWSAELPRAPIKLAAMVGDRVVLALGTRRKSTSRIVAIDAKTGRVLWRYGI